MLRTAAAFGSPATAARWRAPRPPGPTAAAPAAATAAAGLAARVRARAPAVRRRAAPARLGPAASARPWAPVRRLGGGFGLALAGELLRRRGRRGAAASPAGMDMSSRVSMRSTRCSSADSVSLADGSSSRAHTTSSSSRGAVAPRISPSPACTTSAYRVSVAVPIRVAWSRIRSSTSSGPSTTPRAAASGTACSTIRSRKRSSRSVANRRGSWPASITASTAPNSAAASPAASASTASSISATSVAPSSASARWYVDPVARRRRPAAGPAPTACRGASRRRPGSPAGTRRRRR